MSSGPWDQHIINDRIMVTAVQQSLVVNFGEMVGDHHFMYDPADTVMIVPGVPVKSLLPLADHEQEIKALLFVFM